MRAILFYIVTHLQVLYCGLPIIKDRDGTINNSL